jgi:hypothetical protein
MYDLHDDTEESPYTKEVIATMQLASMARGLEVVYGGQAIRETSDGPRQ